MKVLKLIGIFLCMLLIFPTSASENSDTLNITQTKLYDSLSCEKVGETASICLISSQFHSNPKAYVFKFLASGDFDKNKVSELDYYISPLNVTFTIGGGIEYNLGGSTSLIAEVTYNRSLVDNFASDNIYLTTDAKYKLDYVALKVGIIF